MIGSGAAAIPTRGEGLLKPTVYLDVTIPSFYYEERPGTIVQAWREITFQFWDQARNAYDLFLSDETLRELLDPGYPAEKRDKCLALVSDLPRLAVVPEVMELVAYDVAEQLMPADDSVMRFIWHSPPGTASSTWSPGIASTSPMQTNSSTSRCSTPGTVWCHQR
jgi:hypothetical protein